MINHDLLNYYQGYQGQKPSIARIFFFGNDANFSEKSTSHTQFFNAHLKPYLENGVAYWKKEKVHHPFIHRQYPFDKRLDGVRYHTHFRKVYADTILAEKLPEMVSFIELLPYPTVGSIPNNIRLEMISENKNQEVNHIEALLSEIFSIKDPTLVFISQQVADNLNKLKKKRIINNLPYIPQSFFNTKITDTTNNSFTQGNLHLIKSCHFSAQTKDILKIDPVVSRIHNFLKICIHTEAP